MSIITTFFTPYMIRAAHPVAGWVERIVPDNMLAHFENRQHQRQTATPLRKNPWRSLLTALISQVGAYFTLSVAVILISFAALLPLCRGAFGHWPGNITC